MAADNITGSAGSLQVSRLKSERDRFVALAFCWGDLLFELDPQGTIIFASGTTLPILGRTPEEVVGTPLNDILAAPDRTLVRQLMKIAEQRGRIDNATIRLTGKFGTTPPLALAGYRLDELNRHFFLALRMTAPAAGADEPPVTRDDDTGLFDAQSFAGLAAERARKMRSAGEDVRMTLVSMADFEDLRLRLDEASQQTLLTTVGACFRANSANGDSAARFSEDSYGLIHDGGLDISRFEQELQSVTREVDPEGKGASVETATMNLGDAEVSEEDLAKSLLYVVNRFRESEGGAFTIKSLSTNLTTLMNEAAQSVDGFKRIVAGGAFDLAFQPIVHSRSGEIHHYEALARFRSTGSDVSPYQQITFAEETGLITDFDLAIAQKAIEWLGQFPRNTTRYRIAVNISGHSVGSDRYVSSLYAKLRENAWVRDKLMFEITESSRMADLDTANKFIQGLRQVGHHVCLDDFGAGAASFQYLSALDVDVVKLDGSAIRNAQKGPKGRAFLTAMAALCKSLAVETIAEMVDKDEGLFFVRDCGIDFVQGYLFGKPAFDIGAFSPLPKADLFRTRR